MEMCVNKVAVHINGIIISSQVWHSKCLHFPQRSMSFLKIITIRKAKFVRHGSSPTKSGVVRLGFVGQLPCRTTSCISYHPLP